jgi:hypothetical protein
MFVAAAMRLAGMATALIGWKPDEFWCATPAELTTIFEALAPPNGASADADTLSRLKEQFPDG